MRVRMIFLAAAFAVFGATSVQAKSYWSRVPYPDGKACDVTFAANPPSGKMFAGLHIETGKWTKADLAGADFRNAVLQDADFAGANLKGAKFDGAKLCEGSFEGADLRGASFARAHIEHVNFRFANGQGVDFTKALVLASIFGKSDFRNGHFPGAKVICANDMAESACWGDDRFDLSGADLTGATVVGLGGAAREGAKADGGTFDIDAIPDLVKASFSTVRLAPWVQTDHEVAPFTRDEIALMAKTYGTPVPVLTFGPGFDCTKAATNNEHRICASAELSALDGALTRAYAATQTQYPESADMAKAEQRAWLKTRDACADLSCLLEAYETRLTALLKHPGVPARLQPGKYTPAYSGESVPSGVAGTALAARLAVLMANTSDTLAVKGGSVDASVVGMNGHSCGDAGKLVPVPGESGYRTDPDGPLYAGFGDVVVLLGGTTYCGARASWERVWQKRD